MNAIPRRMLAEQIALIYRLSFSPLVGSVLIGAIVAYLAIEDSGLLASAVTLRDAPGFAAFLCAVGALLLVGVLTFVPALALGPMVEHLMLWPR